MRNHLPVGAIRQQQLWNLGKERAVTGVRGKGEEREGGGGKKSRYQHQRRTSSADSDYASGFNFNSENPILAPALNRQDIAPREDY